MGVHLDQSMHPWLLLKTGEGLMASCMPRSLKTWKRCYVTRVASSADLISDLNELRLVRASLNTLHDIGPPDR
jgi:hypothetical protein